MYLAKTSHTKFSERSPGLGAFKVNAHQLQGRTYSHQKPKGASNIPRSLAGRHRLPCSCSDRHVRCWTSRCPLLQHRSWSTIPGQVRSIRRILALGDDGIAIVPRGGATAHGGHSRRWHCRGGRSNRFRRRGLQTTHPLWVLVGGESASADRCRRAHSHDCRSWVSTAGAAPVRGTRARLATTSALRSRSLVRGGYTCACLRCIPKELTARALVRRATAVASCRALVAEMTTVLETGRRGRPWTVDTVQEMVVASGCDHQAIA